ncbi:MAG TPA: class I SAM-dependent methyltransferase [Gemmataceae bacterium]|nr:class I SAM-dependent methyltransferase [Gemmataceae bacterium]
MSEPAFSYDVVSYPSNPLPQAHPARLAAIARLHGVPTASPNRCRFLEVACGDGANLLPLALAYPNSNFVGIDLSGTAIARGEDLRSRLGLANLKLVAADLTAWDPGPDRYDYIISHGLYSWVPPQVRDALFALCRDRLSPAGLAYVSYNALPGCHVRRVLWDILRFHVRDFTDPAERIQQATAMLQFLSKAVVGNAPLPELFREEIRWAQDKTDPSVLYHDDLANINDPVSITDFVAHASRFGLQFLSEAEYFEMTPDLLPPVAADLLRKLAERDVVLKEQYLDFLKLRRFRQTVLCPAGLAVRREADERAVFQLEVTGEPVPDPDPPDLALGVPIKFRTAKGAAISTDHPIAKAALLEVREAFPYPLAASELLMLARRRARAGGDDPEDKDGIAKLLYGCYRVGMVDLYLDPPRFARTAGARPKLSPLARAQLDRGGETMSSLRSTVVQMASPIGLEMFKLLDGRRDRETLVTELANRAAGDPKFVAPGQPPQPASWWRERLATEVESGLAMAAKMALLVEE